MPYGVRIGGVLRRPVENRFPGGWHRGDARVASLLNYVPLERSWSYQLEGASRRASPGISGERPVRVGTAEAWRKVLLWIKALDRVRASRWLCI